MEDKQKIIETSKVIHGETLYEQVYNPKTKKTYFLGWDKKNQETIPIDEIIHDPLKYLPIIDDLLEKKAVILPTDATDYETVEELEIEIESFIQTWLDISEEHRQQATWYVMLSWVLDKLNTIPYLRALGDYGTGKTRYLDVIGGICYKPMFVGGAVRSAPIYRVIDLWRGTGIFDEFTLKKSDESEDIIQILNNGFQRGKPVLRCDSNNYDKVKAFDPFGAKLLGTRTRFYDRALESRCITEIMQMTDRNDIPVDFTSHFYEKRAELQNKLLMYRFKNLDEIKPDESLTIDFGNILPRIKQTLTPFTVLFTTDKNRLTDFIRYAQLHNANVVEENSTSFDGQIFNAYLKLIEEHQEEQQTFDDYHEPTITSSTIRDSLISDGWKEDKITASTIGKRLHALGFKSIPKKITGKTIKILNIEDTKLKLLKKRYVVTVVTEVTGVTEQAFETKEESNE